MIHRLASCCKLVQKPLKVAIRASQMIDTLSQNHTKPGQAIKPTRPMCMHISRCFSIRKGSDGIYDTSDFIQDFPQMYTDALAEVREARKTPDPLSAAFDSICETAVLINILKRKYFLRAHRDTRLEFLNEGDMQTYDDIIAKSSIAVETRLPDDIEASLRLYDMEVATNMQLIFNSNHNDELVERISVYYANLEFEQPKAQLEKSMGLTDAQVIESCARMLKELEKYDYVAKDLEHDNIIRIAYLNDIMEEKGWITFDEIPKSTDHLSQEAAAVVDLLIRRVWLSDEDYSPDILASRN